MAINLHKEIQKGEQDKNNSEGGGYQKLAPGEFFFTPSTFCAIPNHLSELFIIVDWRWREEHWGEVIIGISLFSTPLGSQIHL